ncbi:protein of unknown function [Pseudotevenvirus RB43]|uniref:Uncharacterized protein n=2 Tax=Pseudotevenvirus RB43 TaxID=115991 RepID=Q56BP4_9CAUD|nr:hypothetical protein RB43ORF154c [Escherichia phage RB43]AAX78676.1 hypothetical protein RB43ORF154c [Escherichia phage RB43]CCK74000.1 protein of unknown function [Pseudotevenvirus RB43]CCL97617.1 protein of unknown function [Pseudotevenvirus RB43]
MNRENRYAVIKLSDTDHMDYDDQLKLRALLRKLEKSRVKRGKEPLKAVVVEHDWPEYEQVWKMIETRVDKEDKINKFENMFGSEELFGYFFVVQTKHGQFLITSNAHNVNRLRDYSGYKYRAIFSPDCGFDNKEILATNWGTHFEKVVQVSFEDLVALYDANRSIMNYNVAEFIQNQLVECKIVLA